MLATKIINKIMLDGKKATAQQIFYDALDLSHKRLTDVEEQEEIFNRAIDNIRPSVEVRSKRVGGAKLPSAARGAQEPPAVPGDPLASRQRPQEEGQTDGPTPGRRAGRRLLRFRRFGAVERKRPQDGRGQQGLLALRALGAGGCWPSGRGPSYGAAAKHYLFAENLPRCLRLTAKR